MNEARLAEIEERAKFDWYGALMLRELMREVRRLRGMVDGLLAEQPIGNDGETGVYCAYCKTPLGYCDPEDCAFERAVRARDWEVSDGARQSRDGEKPDETAGPQSR